MSRPAVWEGIIGQERAVDVLARAVAQGSVGHAWVWTGPEGVGQDEAARALTAALVCSERPAGCGACDACRRALRGTHPAYTAFTPTGSHRVDDVRGRWLPAAYASAREGGWKVLHVRAADRMNEAAANALLKGLEEPPAGTVWLLEVADPDAVPETILSRAREVRFVALDADVLTALAEAAGLEDPADRALAVRACLGSPERLRLLAGDRLAGLRAHRDLPRRLREDTPAVSVAIAHELERAAAARAETVEQALREEREELAAAHGDTLPPALARELDERRPRLVREARTRSLQAALDNLATWYRDLLLVPRGAESELVHRDAREELAADAAVIGDRGALEALDALLATRAALEANAQPRLALEALCMRLAAAFAGR